MPLRICDVLLGGAKAALNHLYTVPPRHFSDGGWDAGWFCREHALHVCALAEMLGHRAELCGGELVLDLPADSYRLAMVSTGADHFWCKVDGLAPIDASLTLRLLDDITQPDVALIAPDCPEQRSGIELRYTHRMGIDNIARRMNGNAGPLLHYNLQSAHRPNYGALLDAPYSFLIRSSPTLLDLFGADVFFAITAYLYRLGCAEVEAIDPTLHWTEAMRRVVQEHADARPFVLSKLR